MGDNRISTIDSVPRQMPPEIVPPIPMILTCPSCCERHIDEGEFATKPHHTHACQGCGMVWRPAVVTTVGVRFLPGFKSMSTEQSAKLLSQLKDIVKFVKFVKPIEGLQTDFAIHRLR